MTVRVVHRPARLGAPQTEQRVQALAPPPTMDDGTTSGQGMVAVMMPVLAGTGSLMVVLTNINRPLFAALGLVFFAGSVSLGMLMFASQRRGPRKRIRLQRQRYVQYLDQVRSSLRIAESAQRRSAQWLHPQPDELLTATADPARRWERRRDDDDFLRLRVGSGEMPSHLALRLELGDNPLTAYDQACLVEARRLVADRDTVPDLAVTVDLAQYGALTILGDPENSRTICRASLAQAIAWHGPGDLALIVVRAPALADSWDWVKWAPHTAPGSLRRTQPEGGETLPASGRLVFDSVAESQELLGPVLAQRVIDVRRTKRRYPDALLVVVDGEHLPPHAGITCPDQVVELVDINVHVVYLLSQRRTEPETVDARVELLDDVALLARLSDKHRVMTFAVDRVDIALVRLLARQLAPLRLAAEEAGAGGPDASPSWQSLLVLDDLAALDAAVTWAPRSDANLLRVPIGVDDNGRPVHLDLKESARGGMGPHGMLIGATGSGKSELLRTLVTSLAVTHHPDHLAMVLVDYKGGATFAGLSGLPHCAGIVTNLADDLTLVDRMRDALYGEIQRRQELLKAAGSLPNVFAYEKARANALRVASDANSDLTELPPLPHLLVIIDEFSELLADRPEFAELFVAIGRIGRSIGVHLLLATQRLELGKIRGLETHLSYRIALRTFSDTESREAIGTPDAYRLAPEPGLGYLKVDTTVYQRFRAAHVSAPYSAGGPRTLVAPGSAIRLFTTRETVSVPPPPPLPPPAASATAHPPAVDLSAEVMTGLPQLSLLEVAVARLDLGARRIAEQRNRPVQAHKVWLDPLPATLSLRQVAYSVAARRYASGDSTGRIAVVGLVDSPIAQRQDPFVVDLAGPAANMLVVGGPQTGKSILLRTLVLSASYVHTPHEVAFYLVDAGGGGLRGMAELPHVGSVATRGDPDLIRRTFNEVLMAVERRERAFNSVALDSPAQWRAWRAAGNVLPGDTATGGDPGSDLGDIYLVVDGWGSLRDDFDDLEEVLAEIAADGPAYGVHVIVTVTSPLQVRHKMLPSFSGRLELRLTDPFDSAFGRGLAETLPSNLPGRGLSGSGQLFQTALPRLDEATDMKDLAEAQQRAVRLLATKWGRRPAVPKVRTLPAEIPAAMLPEPTEAGIAIGLSETDLGPARLHLFGADPHLVVFGDSETGKTNTLRVIVEQLTRARSPEDLGIVLVDYRRTMLGAASEEYLMAYCSTRQATESMAAELSGMIAERLPPANVTAAQLQDRSWWRGPEMVVVIDDYDMVATSSGNPLLPLVEMLPYGRDVGLHVIVARRTGGAGRALFDPLLQRLGDLATTGLLHSGARGEGPLACGVPAARLPAGRAIWARRAQNPVQLQIALH